MSDRSSMSLQRVRGINSVGIGINRDFLTRCRRRPVRRYAFTPEEAELFQTG
jgi:hypothetical protein